MYRSYTWQARNAQEALSNYDGLHPFALDPDFTTGYSGILLKSTFWGVNSVIEAVPSSVGCSN